MTYGIWSNMGLKLLCNIKEYHFLNSQLLKSFSICFNIFYSQKFRSSHTINTTKISCNHPDCVCVCHIHILLKGTRRPHITTIFTKFELANFQHIIMGWCVYNLRYIFEKSRKCETLCIPRRKLMCNYT